jgi:hypothetical protein
MKKQVAIALAVIMVFTSVALALAGPRGSFGARGRGGYTSGNQVFKSRSSQPVTPKAKPGEAQGKTGGIKDLGLNPSAKTPADMLKGQSSTGGTPAGQQAQPRASFGGSGGWFGSSWLSWAFLGYLFGRHQRPATHRSSGEIELVPDPD